MQEKMVLISRKRDWSTSKELGQPGIKIFLLQLQLNQEYPQIGYLVDQLMILDDQPISCIWKEILAIFWEMTQ